MKATIATAASILVSSLRAQCPPDQLPPPPGLTSCECGDVNMTTNVVAGTIWPAYGVVTQDGGTAEMVIIPPANCTGSTCWRANVTCEYTTSQKLNAVTTSWSWSWIPTVQYPLGDKDFYTNQQARYRPDLVINDTVGDCSYLKLPGSVQAVNNYWPGQSFDECPTFYYEYNEITNGETTTEAVKFCPVNDARANDDGTTTYTSTMVVYNYLNEQDDGFYTCTFNPGSNQQKACCQPEVYYASPTWNGWCWFGMAYGVLGGLAMLLMLAKFISDSDVHLKDN